MRVDMYSTLIYMYMQCNTWSHSQMQAHSSYVYEHSHVCIRHLRTYIECTLAHKHTTHIHPPPLRVKGADKVRSQLKPSEKDSEVTQEVKAAVTGAREISGEQCRLHVVGQGCDVYGECTVGLLLMYVQGFSAQFHTHSYGGVACVCVWVWVWVCARVCVMCVFT